MHTKMQMSQFNTSPLVEKGWMLIVYIANETVSDHVCCHNNVGI